MHQDSLYYLYNFSQQSLEDLAVPVAQEAVCVQRVLLAIKSELHQVKFVLYWLPSSKGYLCGCPAKIQRSHGRSARAEPMSHKTILQYKETRKTS